MRFLTIYIVLLSALCVYGQEKHSGRVIDLETKSPVPGAIVTVGNNKKTATVSDVNGNFTILAPIGSVIRITCLGYKPLKATVTKAYKVYSMKSTSYTMNEVVVTAQESRSLTSSSLIGRQAMDHLQPSSFGDILELLPGGRAKDPVLNVPNTIHLREAGSGGGNYATSSLGTSFVVDGAPISMNSNMQYVSGATDSESRKRDFTNQGVDMRSIATDDIENVEIVRGIPSVEYGDLTSGLVRIQRKRGGNQLSARMKADMGSQLFYLSKGFEWEPRKLSLNINADYLDSRNDPRNALENYKRLTLSARLHKAWQGERFMTSLSANLDYTGSFDNDKTDPDLNEFAVDTYYSSYNRYAAMVALKINTRNTRLWLRGINATFSTSADYDHIEREKLVQLRRATIAATSRMEGESDAVILPYTYTARHEVEGIPFNAYMKLNARMSIPSQRIQNTLLMGMDWNMDKNYGQGQIFNVNLPLYPGMSGRPRDLSTIPANHTLALYAEETLKTVLKGWTLEMVAGIRGSELLNLSKVYAMHGRIYWDPRVNVGITLPQFSVAGHTSSIRIAGGIGQHTKTPTIEQLYPEPNYIDLVQLNYYHPNEAYKRINIMTYVIDPTNYDLLAARNLKWELSTDINIGGNRLSVTYFRENMVSGFRSTAQYAPYDYKLYDTSGIDNATVTAPPSMDGLPYTDMRELVAFSRYSNGSQTKKEGIEYTFSSRRVERLHTRLTINGAWFRTVHRNSIALMERPSQVIGDRQVPYVGIYNDNEGYTDQSFNTNFTFDTDVPKLRLGFSLSAQCLWFTSNQREPISNEPSYYMDNDGVIRPWDSSLASDIYLRYLVRNNTESMYDLFTIPFSMNVNFKVTKKLFDDHLRIAMFCNKIWDCTPDYERDGVTIRRHVTPYFGLEMNIQL